MESSGLKGPVGAAGTASAAESVEGAERDRSVADRFEDALRKREAGKRKPDPQPGGVPTWLPWLATYEPQLSLNVDARRAALAADVAERAHLAGQRDAGEAAPLPERTQRAERTDAPGDASDRIREKTSAQTSPDAAAVRRQRRWRGCTGRPRIDTPADDRDSGRGSERTTSRDGRWDSDHGSDRRP